MIRTVIIDDEPLARDAIKSILGKYSPEVDVIGNAGDIESAVQLIRIQKPELIILDIHLSDGTGFDLLNRLDASLYRIIFITAFEEYAITAFKFSAIDYILKPVAPMALVAAIEKVQESLDRESMAKRLELLFENINGINPQKRKIALRTSASLYIVNLSEIIRCESEKNYTQFFMSDGESVTVSRTLKEFEEMLGPQDFIRVHQSHLVNLEHIKRFDKAEGGFLVMSDQSHVPVSLRKKDELMKAIAQFRH
jgi:two-component system LytT family response regulator